MSTWSKFTKRFSVFNNRIFGYSAFALGATCCCIAASPLNVLAEDNNNPIRIAIIGSGSGGASFSYFLRELLDKNEKLNNTEVIMDIYERNNVVGGRIKSVNLEEYSGGTLLKDIGATIMIKQNYYMMNFGKNICKLNMKIVGENDKDTDDGYDTGFAFFDQPRGKLSDVWDMKWGTFNLIRKWGFLHFIALMYNARKFVKRFGKIYQLQSDEVSFDNTIDFWTALDMNHTLSGNGLEYVNDEVNKFIPPFYKKKSSKICCGESKYAPSTLQLVTALTRNNYTQNPEDLPPIICAAAVSTLAANGLAYVADGGNHLIQENIIKISKANLLLSTEIKSIKKNDLNNKYILNNSSEYDYVVLATPLSIADIDIDINDNYNKQIDILSQQEYVDVYKYYVKGTLNPKYFGFTDMDDKHLKKVGSIFSSNLGCMAKRNEHRITHKSLPCTTLHKIDGTDWVIFMGAERMTDDMFNDIFINWVKNSLQKFHFKAYPKFSWNRNNLDCLSLEDQKNVLSFIIDKNDNGGMYYLNVLECGMSAMEISAVAGKNVALLVSKQISSQLT